MHRKLPRPLVHAVGFCALALVLLWYLTGLFWNRNGTSMSFYAEPPHTIDVLFLGSSKTNAAVSPIQLYEEHGFTSYVMYSWSQPVWTSYYYMREAFGRQSPQVVVLEGNDLLYARRDDAFTAGINAVNNNVGLLIPAGPNRLGLALAMGRAQTDHPSLFSTLALGRYHANWKDRTLQDWLWPFWQPPHSGNKGFGPLYQHQAFTAPAAAAGAPNSDIWPACLEYLQKCIDLAWEKGAALVLTFYPDAEYTADDLAHIAYLTQYAREQGVTVLDFTDPAAFAAAGLRYEDDMGDHSHLNYHGAKKMTRYLGGAVTDLADLPDHRGDAAYAAWAEDAVIQDLDAERMDIRLETQLDSLLQRTAGGGGTSRCSTFGGIGTSPPT